MKEKKKNKEEKPAKKVSRGLFFNKFKNTEDKVKDAISAVPRITNETVSDHREEVLGSARKFIYPLKHSRLNFVRISLGILIFVVIAFFVYTGLELYDFQSSSGFIYSATEVIPFPIAKVGSSWVSYNSYLFELRRNMHYYESQQQADFSSKSGKDQLASLKEQAMNEVISNAYVKQLAKENDVTVSQDEVNQEIDLVKQQNRLGSSNQVFDNVLKEYWGWTEGDFKQELSQQLLDEKVAAKLDAAATNKANMVEEQLVKGASFATVAQQYSDDSSTKGNGGQYPSPITLSSTNVAPQIVSEVFKLKAGQVSKVINTGYSLDIVEVNSTSTNSVQASHIQINLAPISDYTNALKQKEPPKEYLKV